MKKRYFWQVDAFSKNRYYGNPAAVVFDAEGLSQETMQRIAREMNLSETVFVLPPTEPSAHYWSRIFTPQSELPTSWNRSGFLFLKVDVSVRAISDRRHGSFRKEETDEQAAAAL